MLVLTSFSSLEFNQFPILSSYFLFDVFLILFSLLSCHNLIPWLDFCEYFVAGFPVSSLSLLQFDMLLLKSSLGIL